jgi:alkylation response protein AidB-like acyl-CoA dehydrogenase
MTAITAFTQDQEEIRGVARKFLEREASTLRMREWADGDLDLPSALWSQMSELGWPGIAVAEAHGGAGYGFVERAVLLEEMGRVLLPGPFLASAALAADTLALTDSLASRPILEEVASGGITAVLVGYGDLFSSSSADGGIQAGEAGGQWTITGAAGLTLEAAAADLLLAVADAGDSLGLFAVRSDAPGLQRRPVLLIDATRAAAEVSFDGTPAVRLDDGSDMESVLSAVIARGAISLAAEMIGGAQRCLDMTLAYAKDREQFGAPIGSFQALKHRLADLHVLVDSTRELIYAAARVAADGSGADLRVIAAAAKAAANKAYLRATEETIQMHGGIGFTWEHDAHLFYKRALVSCELLGSSHQQLERVAVAVGV